MTVEDSAARASVPGLPQAGAIVGSYAIERLAGRGGMSAVFEARHTGLDKRVALKMLLPHYAGEREMAQRFAREGAAAARINHPYAVDVTDVGRDETGAPFLVMEFLDGEDLAARLARTGRLSVEQTADILVPVISALAAAHDLGIVHRDLKPQNIMLAQRYRDVVPKVVDFGISKVLEESLHLTGTRALLGTPKYMSPEQASGAGNVDVRSDQFSLGCVLYECLVGQAVFDAPNVFAVLAQLADGKYKRPREIIPELPRTLDAIVVRALRKDPKARFASIREFGAALLPFASMRVQLSFAAEFDPNAARAGGRAEPTPSTSERITTGPASSLTAAAISRVTGARTWLAATRPRRAWGVAAIGAFLAMLGVALPVVLLAIRDHESTSGASMSTPTHPVPLGEKSSPAPRPDPKPPAPEPATYQVSLTVEPRRAWISLDGKPAGVGQMRATLPVDGTEHELRIGARGHKQRTLRFTDTPPPEMLTLERNAPIIR